MKRPAAALTVWLVLAVAAQAGNGPGPAVPSDPRKPCIPCETNDPRAVRGYAIRGKVIALNPEAGTLRVEHGEVPGVMRAMTMEFQAAPEVTQSAAVGREFLGRIERRGKTWWVFDVKWLVYPP